MSRTTLLVITVVVLLGGAVFLSQSGAFGPSPSTTVSTEDGTRVDAPGTRVETNSEGTRVQAPGVDITVPKDKEPASP